MKKLFALLLAVLMIATMSVTAFAAEQTAEGSQTITVTGTYVPGSGTPADVISVDISWGSMAFTYTAGAQVWDPAEHTYTTGEGTWSCDTDANKITIANHSNVAIGVWYAFTDNAEDANTITGAFYDVLGNPGEVQNLIPASEDAVGSPDDAPTAIMTFEITGGTISENSDDLGTITLHIQKGYN